jgi:hypothetical protein
VFSPSPIAKWGVHRAPRRAAPFAIVLIRLSPDASALELGTFPKHSLYIEKHVITVFIFGPRSWSFIPTQSDELPSSRRKIARTVTVLNMRLEGAVIMDTPVLLV